MSGPALSVLSVDLAGDARLSRKLDAREVGYVLGRCEKRIRYALKRHGGSVVSRTDRHLTAFFADGGAAWQSAVEMRERVAALPLYAGLAVSMRIGICSGHHFDEARFFSGDGPNPASRLSAQADPLHILLSLPRRLKLLPEWLPTAEPRQDLPLICGKRRLDICQIAWQEASSPVVQTLLSALGRGPERLRLQHQGRGHRVDVGRPVLSLGRQPGSDIFLRDARCSRQHGTIERCFDRFFFVDRSANGTYLLQENKTPVFIHHKAHVLLGRGRLYLGSPSAEKGVELIEFQASNLI